MDLLQMDFSLGSIAKIMGMAPNGGCKTKATSIAWSAKLTGRPRAAEDRCESYET
jgi:hypothetical protein